MEKDEQVSGAALTGPGSQAALGAAVASPPSVSIPSVNYPVAERAFHVVVVNRGEPDEHFRAKDRATLSSFPAPDREHAYWMADSLNRVVEFHAARAVAQAIAQSQDASS